MSCSKEIYCGSSSLARCASYIKLGKEPSFYYRIISLEERHNIMLKNIECVPLNRKQIAFSYYYLGVLSISLNKNPEEICRYFVKSIEKEEENPVYCVGAILFLMRAGDYGEAQQIYAKSDKDNLAKAMQESPFQQFADEFNFYRVILENKYGKNMIQLIHSIQSKFTFIAQEFQPLKNSFDSVKKELDSQSQQLTQTQNQLDIKTKELDSKSKELDTISKALKQSQDSIQSLTSKNNQLTQSLNSLPIKKQTLEIKNLEQDLKIKELKTKQIEKELGYDYNVLEEVETKVKEIESLKQNIKVKDLELIKRDSRIKELESKSKSLELNQRDSKDSHEFKDSLFNSNLTAKNRIHNHLSYKLGKAMIENSKSLWGYIRMPYVLSYIKEQHNKEQKQYQERIKNNPKSKLPQLESYPDYKEALKEKNTFTYKLGEAFIKANKTWYKGGYVKLWFEVRKLKKEFEK